MTFRLCAFSDEAETKLEGQIEALKRNNIFFTELRSIDGVNIGQIDITKAYEYAEVLKSNNIKVWAIGSPLGKIKIDDDFNEHIKLTEHIIELAKIFKTDKIRIFSFFINNHKADRDKVFSRLKIMTEKAANYGIMLYHENEKDIYGDTAYYVDDLLNNVNGLKSVFDSANFIHCGQDINDAISMLLNKSDYIHIKDALFNTGEVVPPGFGDGKIEYMLSNIKEDKVLTIEPHLKLFSGYGNIDKHELKNKYSYKNNIEAFDAAVKALKIILLNLGYKEHNDKWVK